MGNRAGLDDRGTLSGFTPARWPHSRLPQFPPARNGETARIGFASRGGDLWKGQLRLLGGVAAVALVFGFASGYLGAVIGGTGKTAPVAAVGQLGPPGPAPGMRSGGRGSRERRCRPR